MTDTDTGGKFVRAIGNQNRFRWIWPTLFILTLIAAILLFIHIKRYDHTLKQGRLNNGIVELQLAGSPEKAQQIISDWKSNSLSVAFSSIHWDWALIGAYLTVLVTYLIFFLQVGKIKVEARHLSWAWVFVGAAVLDGIENICLLIILNTEGGVNAAWTQEALIASTGKFTLLIAAAFFLVFITVLFWMSRRSGQGQASDSGVTVLPKEVIEAEHKYISFRREKAGVLDGQPYLGLASSGGGIRSSTVNLGVLQQLSATDCLRRVDYHCTVSGGGYSGSALASLLSFKSSSHLVCPPESDPRDPYRFYPGDRAHFDVADQQRGPLPNHIPGLSNHLPSWISRQMVLDHIRAFGEYLIRRRRLFSRDVLRTVGTVVAGILATTTLFVLIARGIALIILTLSAWTVFNNDQLFYQLFSFQFEERFVHFIKTALTGKFALFGLGLAIGAGAIVIGKRALYFVPTTWFRRSSDTELETQQYRVLWVLGMLMLLCAYLIPPLIIDHLGYLAPVVFMIGGTAASLIIYTIQSLSPDLIEIQNWPIQFTRLNRSFYSSIFGLFLFLTVTTTLMMLLPWAAFKLSRLGDVSVTGTGITGIISAMVAAVTVAYQKLKSPVVSEKIRSLPGMFNKLQAYMKRFVLGVAVFIVIVSITILSLWIAAETVYAHATGTINLWDYMYHLLIAVGLILLIGYFFDFNRLSFHHFYRDRLAEAYLRTVGGIPGQEQTLEIKRDDSEMHLTDLHGNLEGAHPPSHTPANMVISKRGVEPAKILTLFDRITSRLIGKVSGQTLFRWPLIIKLSQKLSFLKAEMIPHRITDAATSAPYHLFATCLNLTTDRNMALRTRKSDSFIFSKLYCGSDTTGYINTSLYRDDDTRVAQAMTISGAAADSALGRSTYFAQSFAATLFNVRLGQWLENPAYQNGCYAYSRENWVFWPKYLFFEAFGMSDARQRLIHLSDGGHSGDNLGLVPLFKRRCEVIIVVDAEADPEYNFTSFNNALRYAEIDDNTHVNINVDPLIPDAETGLSHAPFAVGAIEYRNEENEVMSRGALILIKSALTSEMPLTLHHYRQKHSKFPQEVTVDQFFSEDQFEAYRLLGFEMAKILFEALPALKQEIPEPEALLKMYRTWLYQHQSPAVIYKNRYYP